MNIVLSYDRMMGYLPQFWHEYPEMQELLHAYSVEIDDQNEEQGYILVDAFIMEMREERIAEWEKWLKLPPTGTLMDRRLAILGYFFNGVKMSRESIQAVVAQMYNGARAFVDFYDSTIWIEVKPLPEHSTDFITYWQEVKNNYESWLEFKNDNPEGWQLKSPFKALYDYLWPRKPCHIHLVINRYMSTWWDVRDAASWGDVRDTVHEWSACKYTVWK